MDETIGERLKIYRRRAGMTLQDLADSASLSPSFLSKLESGKVGISVANLDKISNALGIDVIHLVKDQADRELPFVSVEGRRPNIILEGDILYESLGPVIKDFGLVASKVTAKSGQNSGEFTDHTGDELRYILQGQFRFWVGDKVYELNPGDSLSHSANMPHRWENLGDGVGVFLVISTMPFR